MKKILLKNAVENLVSNIEGKLEEVNVASENFNNAILDNLRENGNKNTSLDFLDVETFKDVNNSLKKDDYHFPDFIRVGNLLNYKKTPSKILENASFKTEIPFLLPIKDFGMGFFMNVKYKDRINSIIELSALKVMSSLPNGLIKVSLIDKTGAGQNFPILSTLHEKFIDGKVLSEDTEIELELEALKNSMSTITQSIAANGFASVEDYNKKTDEVPQQYQVICVSNFPTGFNKKSTENLLALMESGPKAGIYTFITFSLNPAYGLNQNINGLTLNDFIKHISLFEISDRPNEYTHNKWINENVEAYRIPIVNEKDFKNLVNNVFSIKFEEADRDKTKEIISILNDKIENINLRPVVDLKKSLPTEFWTREAGKGVYIPFGKRGIENVFLCLGLNQYGEDETTHHGIICGATGSGKTVYIHDLILQIAMNYSPEEVQFFLLDYKEGTEFAVYKDFPYINILSMEGEVEFGLEVLDKAITIMQDRGELFKKVGVANLYNYNKNVDRKDRLPRIIFFIDEFQALIPKNQKIASKANEKLDKILRLGRSFGINLMLATQTLKGVDLDPAILSNMPLRIALRMDEKDAVKVFGEGNPAPKFLKNPGEGIYNKSYGNSKLNVHFQAFRAIDNTVPEVIDLINNHIDLNLSKDVLFRIKEDRFVYNGELEADIKNNERLMNALENDSILENIYLGESAGLQKDHMNITFSNEFGENFLVVGNDQSKATSIFYSSIFQLARTNSKIFLSNYNSQIDKLLKDKLKNDLKADDFKKIKFFTNKDSEEALLEVEKILLERKEIIAKNPEKINELEKIFFFQYFIESAQIFNPQGFKDKNIEKLFLLIKEGPEYGIHSIYYATDFNTITATDISRELSKFKKKVALQGGNSLKIFGADAGIEFSKSTHIAIINTGEIGMENKKFKPYVFEGLKGED